jgi:hypothetical protein
MIRIVTNFRVLIKLAKELSNAEKTGDLNKIKIAKEKHDQYKALCLSADSMNLGITSGEL